MNQGCDFYGFFLMVALGVGFLFFIHAIGLIKGEKIGLYKGMLVMEIIAVID